MLAHIESLSHEKRRAAEEYVRRAPAQVDTDYRRHLERDLGWKRVGDSMSFNRTRLYGK